eukprot:TRINITY_DN19075_c0_g1_i2.p1 TRINITY_DN19075_c0_g1~~TRINITY_DN19075_c0_g1_i2.p1  ORF type:complete len:267 (+),score=50.16 TRINITY_DN19075_c0_g1_i2:233-1033(+)
MSMVMNKVTPNQVRKLQDVISKAARVMLTATFLEDAVRIITEFNPQLKFLALSRGMPSAISYFVLFFSVLVSLGGSAAIIAQRKTSWAVGGLISVLLMQTVAYGYIFDVTFMVRNVAVAGGLLIILAHEKVIELRSTPFSGAFNLGGSTKLTYLQLVSRCFVAMLFYSLLGNHWTVLRIVGSVIVALPVMAVVLGYRARFSASILAVFLLIANFVLNGYWTLPYNHPERDFRKYYFFQTLTVTGGLLILAEMGPGGISFDERDKDM